MRQKFKSTRRPTVYYQHRRYRGRKRKLLRESTRQFYVIAHINRRKSVTRITVEIKTEFNLTVNPWTIRNQLNAAGFSGQIAVKSHGYLQEKNQKLRLRWAKEILNWSIVRRLLVQMKQKYCYLVLMELLKTEDKRVNAWKSMYHAMYAVRWPGMMW